MSRTVSTGSMKSRPAKVQSNKSFTRYEPTQTAPNTSRNRDSTVQSTVTGPLAEPPPVSPRKILPSNHLDIFDQPAEEEDSVSPGLDQSQSLPERLDELPVEVANLVDRFLESLGAKVFSEPPTIDQLSELFQEFYVRASNTIAIHISTLASRLNRDASPVPSRSTASVKSLIKKPSTESLRGPDKSHQMLTVSEVNEKRKARRALEYRRILLEEAVERKLCEAVYDKLWRHKSTLDEVRDEKLRSKTAALALVGIGLRDLGVELDSTSTKSLEDVQQCLAPAQDELTKMDREKYPLGKLQHLTRAHKSIVDTLYSIHASSSSADDILPTLIYTLITSPLEGINIISNLYFVQRFRNASKIDGEAAYCLTNLEAAISFLENVDLASLRRDEQMEGPSKSSSTPSSPAPEKPDPFPTLTTSAETTTATNASNASASTLELPNRPANAASTSPPPPQGHQRTLSNALQPAAKAIGVANDAVRNTADNISSTLDNSFKFLFGRLREQSKDDTSGDVVVPKTLDEARQLVSRPLTPTEDGLMSDASSLAEKEVDSPRKLSVSDDKFLGLFGGQRPGSVRDRSVDSVRSSGSGSGRKVVFAATGTPSDPTSGQKALPTAASNPLDSMKNLGNSLNPLSHLGSAFGGGFRSFGKAVSPSPPTQEKMTRSSEVAAAAAAAATPVLTVSKSVAGETLRFAPPIPRFINLKDPGELTVGDIPELLQDYQRLALILKGLSHG